MRVTLVRGRLRVVVSSSSSPSSPSLASVSRVRGGRVLGLVVDSDVVGVSPGLMSLVIGGLVLVMVPVGVDVADRVPPADDAGGGM